MRSKDRPLRFRIPPEGGFDELRIYLAKFQNLRRSSHKKQQGKMADPLNLISNPPSTVVKVQGTARDDVNGQLGIAIQYAADRGRYVVHMVSTQTTMALKPDNVAKASTFESYQAQFQQVMKDPRMRREITRYYNMAQSKLGVKPEYAASALLLVVLLAMYFVGFTPTLMLISVVMIVGLIIGPDVMNSASPQLIAQNFPLRCRQTIEQSAPFLKGRLSNAVAAAIVILMLAFGVRTLFVSQGKSAAPASLDSAARSIHLSPRFEDAYKNGFEDASKGNAFGTSLSSGASAASGASPITTEEDYSFYDTPSSPPSSKPSFGFSQAMSAFMIYRTVMELGNDPATGFSVRTAMANARVMDTWKLGILGFSCYNVVRAFI